MNTTMPTTVDDRIAAFADAVRLHLSDLPTDDADDILDSLRADLHEQAADAGAAFELPDAGAYAAELRAAAGLPVHPDAPARPNAPRRVMHAFASGAAALRANPVIAWLVDFVATMRPAWWIARGYAAYVCLHVLVAPFHQRQAVPSNATDWMALVAVVLVSIQWGRGRWLPRRIVAVVSLVWTLVALLLVPLVVTRAATELIGIGHDRARDAAPVDSVVRPGLTQDGERIRNIFAYDAQGRPLTDVRLYDQSGDPLLTTGWSGSSQRWDVDEYFFGGGGPAPVPFLTDTQQRLWNVYPLRELAPGDSSADWSEATTPEAPRATVPRLQPAVAPNTPSPTPTPSGSGPAE